MTENRTYSIEGMTCDHCAQSLAEALRAVPGVKTAEVSFKQRRAKIEAEAGVDDERVFDAANANGFRASLAAGSGAKGTRSDEMNFDLVVIGSGGAAVAAALEASGLGASVAVVERGTIGGTCVNVGCVPSKTLIRAAESLHRAQSTPFQGISVRGGLINYKEVLEQKDELVGNLRQAKYIDILDATPGISLVKGEGAFVARGKLRVGNRVLRSDRFVIATGSSPSVPPIPGLSDSGFLTSTELMDLKELPAELLVLGGRYVALELAQAFSRLGSRVTIIQRSNHILPTEDDDLTEALSGYLSEEGIDVITGALTTAVQRNDAGYQLKVTVQGRSKTFSGSHLFAATGRRPNTAALHLDTVGVAIASDGTITVGDHLETSVPGIFAAGDVIGNPAFVYTAAYEGRVAARNALNGTREARDYKALPWVVFTDPQVAGVGLDERTAAEAGIAVDVATLPLSALPRALAARDTRGFIKLIKERGGERLLGARILAPEAGDIIMEPALAIRHGISVDDLVGTFHPYLTQAEGIRLAAQSFNKDVSELSCCA